MKAKIVAVALLAMMSSSVMAQTKDQSFSAYGNYSKESGAEGASGTIVGSYGFMPMQSVELTFQLGAIFQSGANDDTQALYGAGAKYYFGAVGQAGSIVPYLKADVVKIDKYTQYGGGVGLDYALSESASLFVELMAQKRRLDGNSTSLTQMNLGIAYRF